MLRRFWNEEIGATSVEYALIASLIALAIVTSVTRYAESAGNMYKYISDSITGVNNGGGGATP